MSSFLNARNEFFAVTFCLFVCRLFVCRLFLCLFVFVCLFLLRALLQNCVLSARIVFCAQCRHYVLCSVHAMISSLSARTVFCAQHTQRRVPIPLCGKQNKAKQNRALKRRGMRQATCDTWYSSGRTVPLTVSHRNRFINSVIYRTGHFKLNPDLFIFLCLFDKTCLGGMFL